MAREYWCHGCDDVRSATVAPDGDAACDTCGGCFVERLESGGERAEAAAFAAPDPPAVTAPPPPPPQPVWPASVQRHSPLPPPAVDPFAQLLTGFAQNLLGQALGIPTSASHSRTLPPYLHDEYSTEHIAGLSDAEYDAFLQRVMDEHEGNGPPPATKAAVDELQRFAVNVQFLRETDTEGCSICQESWQLRDPCLRMPCGHSFHADCLSPWLAMHCTCPTCRHELPADDARGSPSAT